MLAIQKQSKYFSKIVAMPNGQTALVFFELIERNGHVVAKAIHAEAIDINTVPEQKVYALPTIKSSTKFVPIKSAFIDLVSTFSRDFSFTTCQITRAPNFC